MTHTANVGPQISAGYFSAPLPGTTIPLTNPDAGPDMQFQGNATLDPRYTIANGSDGPFYSLMQNTWSILIDTAPSATSSVIVAAAQTGTSGSNLTLAANGAPLKHIRVTNPGSLASPGATGPYSSAPTVVIAGTSSTGAAATATVINGFVTSVAVGTLGNGFTAAPTISFSGGGLATGAIPAAATAYTAFQPVTAVPVWPPTSTSAVTPTGGKAYAIEGPFLPLTPSRVHSIFDASTSVARNLRVVSNNAGDTSNQIFVSGYDLYGRAETETINVSANATNFGKKAWKYVTSVQFRSTSSSSTTAGTISVGTADVIGFPIYTPLGELTTIWWNGSMVTATTGFVAPDTTNPATSATGDPRGTWLIQASSSDGTKRLFIAVAQATPTTLMMNPQVTWPLAGVTPA